MLNKLIICCVLLYVGHTAHAQKKNSDAKKARPTERFVEMQTSMGRMVIRLYNATPGHRDNFIKLVNQHVYDSLLFHYVVDSFIAASGDPVSKYAAQEIQLGVNDIGYSLPAEIQPAIWHKRGAIAMSKMGGENPESSGSLFYFVWGKYYTPKEVVNIVNNWNQQKKLAIFNQVMKSDSIRARIDILTAKGDSEGLTKLLESVQPVVDSLFDPMYFEPKSNYTGFYSQIPGLPMYDREDTVFGEVVEGMDVLEKIMQVQVNALYRPVNPVRILQLRMLN